MIESHKPEEFDIVSFFDGFFTALLKTVICIAIFIAGFMTCAMLIPVKESKPWIHRFKVRIDNRPELNQESVYQQILDYEILEPEIVLRQSILETGWYTSKNCIERNNCFGMKGAAFAGRIQNRCAYCYKNTCTCQRHRSMENTNG